MSFRIESSGIELITHSVTSYALETVKEAAWMFIRFFIKFIEGIEESNFFIYNVIKKLKLK